MKGKIKSTLQKHIYQLELNEKRCLVTLDLKSNEGDVIIVEKKLFERVSAQRNPFLRNKSRDPK